MKSAQGQPLLHDAAFYTLTHVEPERAAEVFDLFRASIEDEF